jgi:hypothetical protein
MELKKKALLISSGSNSHNNTEDLKECLRMGQYSDYQILILNNPTSTEAEREIEKFLADRNNRNCHLFLYIAGDINNSAVQNSVNKSEAAQIVVFIDSQCDFSIDRNNIALISGSGITPYLIDSLNSGNTDSDKESIIDVNDIYLYIYKRMVVSEKRDTLCRRINSSGILPILIKRDEENNLPDLKEGWGIIKENETYSFFVLYLELDFDNDIYLIDELWADHIENYLFDAELDDGSKWKKFCGNDVSKKRIYIAPVKKENLPIVKSIFRIFLNKQVDDIRVNKKEIKTRYFFTTLELPYKIVDSSERLVPSCSNIYKLAENLDDDKLYLSRDVIDLLPMNIRKNLKQISHKSDIFTYTFNLLT